MAENPPQIFIAHASEDKPLVRELYAKLKQAGYKPWLDEEDLLPGQNWRDEIPKALKNSDLFLACLSSTSISKRGYIQKELRMAIDKLAEIPPGDIYLIPLKLDNCEIPEIRHSQYGLNLKDIQWLDYLTSNGFEKLLNAIKYQSSRNEKGQPIKIDENKIPKEEVSLYQKWDEQAIKDFIKAFRENSWQCVANLTENDYTQTGYTGIDFVDKISKQLTDLSQNYVMRYGVKLAFSPNLEQQYFISGGNQTIKRWEQETWEIIQEISVPGNFDLWVTDVAISPDGKLIAGSKAYEIKVWKLGEENPIYTFPKSYFSNFFDVFGFDSIAFSLDSQILAAKNNQDISIWSLQNGTEVTKLYGHSDKVTAIAFHPNIQEVLVSCGYDKSVKVWNVKTQKCLGTLSGHKDAVYSVAFSPDGEILVSGSEDNTLKLWHPFSGEMPKTLRQHSDAINSIVFHPDGTTFFSGSSDGSIIEWTKTGKQITIFPQQHPRGVTSLSLSPDGRTLLSGGRDQTIRVWRKNEK